jgi:NitT/TauT family transport system substrate-binding protein
VTVEHRSTRPTPRRRGRFGRLALAAALLPLVAVAACSYGSKSDKSDAAPTPTGGKKLSASTVKIGYFANLTHATPLIGIQQGLFQKQLGGTKIQTAVFNAGPAEIEALNSGSIDIGWIGPSPSINGYTKSGGKDLRIISGSASGGVELVVNPKRITSLKDVKGKKIATPQLGNTQDVALLHWIKTQGWKVDAQTGKGDVSVVRTDNKITPDAFKNGSIDGAWVPEPTASKLVAEGGKVLLDERDLWKDGKFVITNVIVSQKFLKAHPDVVNAVLRASVDTNAWINANPAKAKAAANAALTKLSGAPLPANVIDSAWKTILVTNDPLASTARTEANHAVGTGLLTDPLLKGIYDLKPLNAILKKDGQPTVSAAGLGSQ